MIEEFVKMVLNVKFPKTIDYIEVPEKIHYEINQYLYTKPIYSVYDRICILMFLLKGKTDAFIMKNKQEQVIATANSLDECVGLLKRLDNLKVML